MRRSTLVALSALLAGPSLLSSRSALAQCTVEGSIELSSMREPSLAAAPITQAMRVTFRGREATVEGTAPLAFRAVIAAQNVRVFIGDGGFTSGLVSASSGAEVRVIDTRGSDVIASIRASDELEARGVLLPCAALSARRATAQRVSLPEYPASRRWTSDSIVNVRPHCDARGCEGLVSPTPTVRGPFQCTGRAGSVRCAPSPHAGRCQPVGDGSWCGYHPVRASLRIYRAPSARSDSIEVVATRDVSFVDDDGRVGWLRVQSSAFSGNALVVRGWVRAAHVRWTQEVAPSARNVGLGAYGVITGRARAIGARVGFVVLARETSIEDAAGAAIARVADAEWCTAAEHPANATHVRVALPGSSAPSEDARVALREARWVQDCPR
jgi:hypothetical protein